MPMRPPPRVVLLVLTVAIALLVGLSMPAAPLSGRTQVRSTSAEPSLVGPTKGALLGVSCPSATRCYAVGVTGTKTLVETWNGSRWSIVASPMSSGWLNARLSSVSCPSTRSCYAVGGYQTDAYSQPLLEHWDGSRWSIVAIPVPAGSASADLKGVSCHDPTSCFAVGDFFATTQKLFVEHWDGAGWTVSVLDLAGNTSPVLNAVSCPSITRCFAVGSYIPSLNVRSTLVERWDGSSWSVMASSNPDGNAGPVLDAVSCPSTSSCNAVGDDFPSGETKPLAEHWDGTTWSVVPSPNAKGSRFVALYGVSCPSATSCFAVGSYDTGSRVRSSVEHWNGSAWSLGADANPAGAKLTVLYGVSCRGTGCLAVGTWVDGVDQTGSAVLERWDGSRWAISDPIAVHATFECTIWSRANGKYVSADPAILRSLRANAVKAGASQRYQCVAIESNKWAFKSLGDGRYVTMEGNYAGVFKRELRAVSNAIGSAEKYTLVPVASCTCLAIKAANSKYVTTELGYTGAIRGLLRARSATIGSLQEFDVEVR